MSLQDYRKKRDFSRTREPAPEGTARKGRALFVVQLHHASRRHFDFRLQVGDVLRSWAVPKGPSYDPAVKRLAVEVEDHPVSYADFEGDIEHGYGKGHVDTFDRGVWSSAGDIEAQLQKGHLSFELFGKRLKGAWHLVRSGRKERQPAWFLIKADDAYAGDVEADDMLDAKMRASTRKAAKTPATKAAAKKSTARKKAAPRARRTPVAALAKAAAAISGAKARKPNGAFFAPQLARLRETPPQGDQWLHEVKWDGYRILTSIARGEVNTWSRNALPWNERIPEIVQAIEALGLDSARLDGELIAVDAQGRSDFNALQKTLSGEANAPLVYMLFDLPYLQGQDLSRTALHERKALLERLLAHAPAHLGYSGHNVGDGDGVFAMAMEQKLEGIISKRVDGAYHSGRNDDWLKIKRLEADEFAVVGYTPAKGSRVAFGSLLLAKPGAKGRWTYVGRVGTGFTDEMLRDLGKTLATRGKPKPPMPLDKIDPLLRGALWVEPSAVAEVYFRGIGNQGLLRQPSLKALRIDKAPADLHDSDRAPAKPARKTPMASDEITITHPGRVVFPNDGITKQDVADYYKAVMPWFLPPVADRPMPMLRCPGGIGEHCFFQKHTMAGLHHVGTAKLKEETGAQAVYLYPKDEAGLLELVQFGAIEFHPWGSHVKTPDKADRVIFDLDPGDNVAWKRVIAAARMVRGFLKQLGLESFVRTTGGKGLHVVVPLAPAAKWETVRTFARGFAEAMAEAHPLEFVATASKKVRGGKIYLDYLRNGRGATAVASYSLRARAGAPVAVPVRWDDLGKLKSGADFTIHTVPKRLARQKKDPWEGIDAVKQGLDEVMEQLGL
ncbi:DNA ligase D [Luteibacter yeojuensis]|uniref:DNA ligase (ATP) n=1 Tax=Luteibacter yeojuensis TaxID=345309 RepID=A0A0F3KYJ6_9GAMM|nr:DNA ligase D [Luteibacter yeojuensis]KJV35179.1 ATP-dependent DNA ligase [Luteibacter yeojuensis]